MDNRILILLLLLLPVQLVIAQNITPRDSVSLEDCQIWAREFHPLLKQKELYKQIAGLEIENNNVKNLPQVSLDAQATYQSEVPAVNISMPGVSFPQVPKDQYKIYFDLKQNIWNGGLVKAGETVEEAQGRSNRQQVEVELYKIRQHVNEQFFSSFILQENLNILMRKKETLEAQKAFMASGVRNGIILQSDLDQILAELIKVRQQQTELQLNRETVLSTLAILTGKETAGLQNLAIQSKEPVFNSVIERPEIGFFESQNEVLAASADLVRKGRYPALYGFGQAGIGRPGLNMFNRDFKEYYLAGIGLSWKVFDWKNSSRERSIFQLQKELVQTRQKEFERNVRIALDGEHRKILNLANMLEGDRELIELQERITKSSASKLRNGAITVSDFIKDLNEEMVSRITFETHKVQLEAARINYQTIRGGDN